jgi:large subunit ribosomal protein L24
MKTKLKKNDTVTVIAGKDKGKTGRVLRIDEDGGRVLVEGVNMVKKAQRKQRQEDTGGIIEKEAPIAISNVMYAGKDGKPARLGYRVEGGEKVRFSRKTGETV